MIILGLNAYHGDSSACIVVDGKLIAAVEEERFTRIKHWAGFPKESIKYCLQESGASLQDVEHIAINRDPKANFLNKSLYAFAKRPSLKLVTDRLKNASKVKDIEKILCHELGVESTAVKAQFHKVEHHIAHLASTFFISPFDNAAAVSLIAKKV